MSEGRQGNLFEGGRDSGSRPNGPPLNPAPRLKAAMRQAMSESWLSRAQIVDRMNERAAREGLGNGRGNRISLAALDGWVAETKANLIPVNLLPLFCRAAETLLPLAVLAGCLDAGVITPQRKSRDFYRRCND